jgi:hypothetical protein
MNHSALRLPLVIATTALISLASASPGSAQVNIQASPPRPPAAAHQKETTKAHGFPVGSVRQPTSHVAAHKTTVRTVRSTTVRTAGGTTVARSGYWVWRGGRHVWQSYGFTGAGYAYGPGATGAVYSRTDGATGHSCWWYRHYDPTDLPRWCPRYYGSSYGYSYGYSAPSYSYSYGYSAPAYSYGYRYGAYRDRYGATRTTSTRVTSTRVTNVSTARFTHGVRQGGAHVAVARPAGAPLDRHAQAGARVRAPSAAGAHLRTQTSP